MIFKVRTDKPSFNGLIGFAATLSSSTPHQLVVRNTFSDPSMSTYQLNPGDEVELLEGPKRKQGINLVTVKNAQTKNVGHLFWCEFKANMILPMKVSSKFKPK